jgi:HK97 family phage portal protein
MKLFGWEISRPREKAVGDYTPSALTNLWSWPIVREPFTGAWQRNMEIRQDSAIRHHAVYACITLIAQDIGKLRIKLVQQDASSGIWEETTSPAFSPVLRRPNRYQNRIEFLEQWLYSKLTWGNTYVLIERDKRGVVVALYILDPARTKVLVAPDGAIYYQLYANPLTGVTEEALVVPQSEIIHDRMSAIFHPLCGLSPLTACGLSALQGIEALSQSVDQFRNQAVPSGILIAPGAISQDTADRLKEKWMANYGGSNVGRVAVLGDNMKFERMGINPVDAQFIEQVKWSAESICAAFHVPAFMVTQSAPTYNNVEALGLSYYSQCLQTHIEKIELCLDEGLGLVDVPGVVYGTELDVDDGLLRMDSKTKMDVVGAGVQRAILSPNDARKRFDMPPVKGGDVPLAQQQYWPLDILVQRESVPSAGLMPPPGANPTLPSPTPPGASAPAKGLDDDRIHLASYEFTKSLLEDA